jgi:hypothetical protein
VSSRSDFIEDSLLAEFNSASLLFRLSGARRKQLAQSA